MQQLAEAWHLLGNLAHKSYWSIDGALSQGEEQLVSLFLSGAIGLLGHSLPLVPHRAQARRRVPWYYPSAAKARRRVPWYSPSAA